MNASIKGALADINRSYGAFTHKGNYLTKEQVKKILEYGLSKGYKTTDELSDDEVDNILKKGKDRRK